MGCTPANNHKHLPEGFSTTRSRAGCVGGSAAANELAASYVVTAVEATFNRSTRATSIAL